jgi:ubiquinone/menaquinone biosynthesis C-methylase UbiE
MAVASQDPYLVRAEPDVSNEEANSRWEESLVALGDRSAYKRVWDRQASELDTATLAVAGHLDDARLDASAGDTINILRETVGVGRHDVILEIGCGIARVGKVLSGQCLHWFGADISGAMLRHAASRLEAAKNTTLVELTTVGLQEFPSGAFDLVYCTVVFMHLLEWDRFRYVEESFRVLRPGGRCYFDNFPLDTPHGWEVFTAGAAFPLVRRPAQISMASTREELRVYLAKAGFAEIAIHELPSGLIAATGTKPGV